MATLGFLLTNSPLQHEHFDTFAALAQAALDKGHKVRAFFYLDGTLSPIKHQTFPDLDVMPRHKLAKLVEGGAEITCCGICVNARGLEKGKEYIDGIRVGGLPDFAEIISETDRLITL